MSLQSHLHFGVRMIKNFYGILDYQTEKSNQRKHSAWFKRNAHFIKLGISKNIFGIIFSTKMTVSKTVISKPSNKQ